MLGEQCSSALTKIPIIGVNMSTTTEITKDEIANQGFQLANIRQQKGFSIDYVASKLHLRTRIIELIENNDFHLLPEPVFVKGYLRAYSKLLGISADPLIALFDAQYTCEKKPERAALWQSKRESHKADHVIRWFTLLFALGVIVAVGFWWQKNRENQPVYAVEKKLSSELSLNEEDSQSQTDLKLTDLSKMQALLTPPPEHMTPMENNGE